MDSENVLWGAERIRGELLTLGIRVSKRTIQRHMNKARLPGLPRGQNWRTFLKNHTVWACDFLQTYDIWFRPVFAFFIVDINTKRVVHVTVTRSPTAEWTAQQLRNITPFGEGPQFIIRDNDNKFGAEFDHVVKGEGSRYCAQQFRHLYGIQFAKDSLDNRPRLRLLDSLLVVFQTKDT
jgi:hypothetical protein